MHIVKKNTSSLPLLTTVKGLMVLCFLCMGGVATSQVSSSVDTLQIRIGEEVQYTVEVAADSTDLVIFPEGQTFLPLEVIESYKVDTTYEQARVKLIKKYGLTQFDSGSYTIPAQQIYVNEKPFSTDSVKIEVADVVVDTTQQKMFDIKPALEIDRPPFNVFTLILWILAIVLILAGVAYFFFRRKKRREEAEKQLPPYEEALVALQNLDNSELLAENKSKEYYSGLTEIVKRYLHREVDDTALESTSDELIERLQLHKDAGHFEFDTQTIKKLDSILKRADLVKFAKMSQQSGQASADRNVIEEIINETKEVIPEPTEEELLENEEYLERLRIRKRRKQWITGIAGVFAAGILAAAIYGGVNGFDNLQDHLLGNETRDLSEGRWIKSEYGSPVVIIETPKVLVRAEVDTVSSRSVLVKNKDIFTAGTIQDELYVKVSTTQFNQPQELELEGALDEALALLERGGAKNMLVKRESFETQKGIKGIKAFGEFNVQVSDDKVLTEPSSYELLLFAQQNGLQEVLVVYQDDERFAEGIKQRITNSVELEISEK